MRTILSLFFLFLPLTMFGQKAYYLPGEPVFDTINCKGYKIFIVHPDMGEKFFEGTKEFFQVDVSIYQEVERAIMEQYLDAEAKHLDLEELSVPYPITLKDTTKAYFDEFKASRRKEILKSVKKLINSIGIIWVSKIIKEKSGFISYLTRIA